MNDSKQEGLGWWSAKAEPRGRQGTARCWFLGVRKGDQVDEVQASVLRLDNGSWEWEVIEADRRGNEPSLDEAIREAERWVCTQS